VQGLTETKHPFAFVARTATRELLEARGGGEKALQLLRRLIPAVSYIPVPPGVHWKLWTSTMFVNSRILVPSDMQRTIFFNSNPYFLRAFNRSKDTGTV
jgi:hypothetical protein